MYLCSFVGLGFFLLFLLCKALLDHWELALYKYCILLLLLLVNFCEKYNACTQSEQKQRRTQLALMDISKT